MSSSLSPAGRRALEAAAATFACFGLAVGLAGCPVAAELEDPGRFPVLAGAAGTGTGGAGGGGNNCAQPLTSVTLASGCDWLTALGRPGLAGACVRGGCHNAETRSAQLNLTADDFLIARILEVPSKHASITCGVGMPCVASAMTCDACSMCPSGPTDVLLSKTNVSGSWMLQKMAALDISSPGSVVQMGCGTAMPYPPGHMGYTAARRDCLVEFFTWIAQNGRECDLGPMGGAGGGGAGGAGAGGAGAGGASTSGAGGT